MVTRVMKKGYKGLQKGCKGLQKGLYYIIIVKIHIPQDAPPAPAIPQYNHLSAHLAAGFAALIPFPPRGRGRAQIQNNPPPLPSNLPPPAPLLPALPIITNQVPALMIPPIPAHQYNNLPPDIAAQYAALPPLAPPRPRGRPRGRVQDNPPTLPPTLDLAAYQLHTRLLSLLDLHLDKDPEAEFKMILLQWHQLLI
ncbi:hypothetical protein BDQ12DRAFT_672018 [Crucibulum laeve]|uniref:Uncharacterized protein n=1 Tax=Crucibulum laeve TaxID=68775 RepID=A0A5C3LET2_9AGAR|nr:hypothetical protein BDQ12DRAFT_672018 [Crucibulum laeve]